MSAVKIKTSGVSSTDIFHSSSLALISPVYFRVHFPSEEEGCFFVSNGVLFLFVDSGWLSRVLFKNWQVALA